MKKTSVFIIIFFLVIKVFSQSGISHMNADKWEEDLDFLTKRINKSFISPTPGIKDKFNEEAKKLKQNLSNLNNKEIAIAYGRLVAGLGDGHTEISLLQKAANFKRLPVYMYFFDKELYIISVKENNENLLGKKVLKIGNKNVDDIYENVKELLAHDNKMEFIHEAPNYMTIIEVLKSIGAIDKENEINLLVQDEKGKQEIVSVKSMSRNDYYSKSWIRLREYLGNKTPLYLQNFSKNYWYQYIESSKAVYFNYLRVSNQKGEKNLKQFLRDMFKEIDELKPEKLIIDLRSNRGGNYHLSEPLLKAVKERPWLNKKQKLFVITGRTTFSAAAVTAIWFKQETNGILIGEPSRSKPNGTDNYEPFTLPNSKLEVGYTDKLKNHMPEIGDAPFLPVDIPIENTIKEYANGTDKILEYILTGKQKIN